MQTFISIRTSIKALQLPCLVFLVCVLGGDFSASAQNIQVRGDLEFNLLDFAQIPGTAALGTNSSISYSGGLNGSGFGTPGEIRVTGKNGTTVDISCSSTAALSNEVDTVGVISIEMVVGTGTSVGGPGSVSCAGVGLNIIQLTTGNSNPNTALIGATLSTSGTESGGDYDTASAGGTAIVVEMVVP